MNQCVSCGEKYGALANFCGNCGILMPVNKEQKVSEEERQDYERERSEDDAGVCSPSYHILIQAMSGHCWKCKFSCRNPHHQEFRVKPPKYCIACGKKF